jgi:DNA-binding beta-propeller fold protein YncE
MMKLSNAPADVIRGLFAPLLVSALIAFATSAHAAILYVSYTNPSEGGGPSIHRFDPTGADLGAFGAEPGGQALSLVFDGSGNLYEGPNAIHKVGPTGADLGIFASAGLDATYGLAFDSSGNLYASNGNNGRILKFGPTGADLGEFAITGSNPRGIAFDKSGNLSAC